MLAEVGFWGSFWSGTTLLLMCCLGLRGFFRRIRHSETEASRKLALAIVLGFFAAGLNTLYWQVLGQALIAADIATIQAIRRFGGFFDIGVKGLAAYAVYTHLAAWRLSLPEDEQRQWTVLGMAFYPKSTGYLVKALNGLLREKR